MKNGPDAEVCTHEQAPLAAGASMAKAVQAIPSNRDPTAGGMPWEKR